MVGVLVKDRTLPGSPDYHPPLSEAIPSGQVNGQRKESIQGAADLGGQ